MTILMEEPAKYIAEIAAGKIIRYGAILKDAGTGQIIGHLKETGQMGDILSSISTSPFSLTSSINPASIITNAIGQTINGVQIHHVQKSVDQIQQTLNGLELINNISALSSIAGLGVSVAGFAAVNNKLNKIDSKLDKIASNIKTIKNVLDNLQENWQAMDIAKFNSAVETLLTAELANTAERRLELAKNAVEHFCLLKHYYSSLLSKHGLFEDSALSTNHLHEITARYTVACLGVLQAEFMIGDLGSYRARLETINREFPDLVTFSPQKIFQARCDQLPPLSLDHDFQAHSDSLVELSRYSTETAARIESHMVELEYLEKNNLTVTEYLGALQDHETDIVVIPR